MLKLKSWFFAVLVLAILVAPVMAGNNNAKTPNDNTANTANTETNAAASPDPNPSPSINPSVSLAATDANVTALLGVLVMKGVLAPTEANAIQNASPNAQFQALVEALSRKGVLNVADLSPAAKPATTPAVAAVAVPAPEAMSASSMASVEAGQTPPSRVAGELKPPPPAVIAAVAPVRVFPVDPPKPGGLAGLKVGPVTLAPYGFIKATLIHDSSDPDGDDFPFPGIWLNSGNILSTGPTKDPEFHIKARSTRFGMNFEWPDVSPKLTLTGKIEGDFEGNFSEVNNRDVSSIRSNMPQLRLAFVRLDYHASDATDIFFVGGQDWTLFGSGAMMNIVETTFNGAFWGNIYTRSPQLRGGFVQTLNKDNNVNLEGQFGIMMPSSGQILKLGSLGLAGQLGEGEREGADSDRPEYEGRAALSYQLDKAKGVAPAQIALAGFHARRTSIAYNTSAVGSSVPYGDLCATTNYCNTFPSGFEASSTMWGGQIVAQVPTRWFTLVASAYKGGDLRFYFGGQINSFATDVGGLTGLQGPFPTLDGGPLAAAGGAVLGCTGTFTATGPAVDGITPGSCSGSVVVAPQRPIRSFGGFLQLGLPLSRWFNADPKGHNAGWQLQFTVGKDQVVNRDLNNPGYTGANGVYNGGGTAPLPLLMGKSAIGTLYYKINPWATFAFEQSIYATRGLDHADIYTIAGAPSNEWQDHRTEFGPIFTF
ncbi:MAG TPA: hypothetical protein VK828_07830 [Terriglobales bacterium]|jgi:hypothetical protein|nr:hypothetical protein [Terriglobales bacterium]